ncbi:hypothetical protein C8K44_11859 [Aminobacter sp. AP02]|nr:hypothetical protein C8K44_11859 [Aminobacter sp. AP02]
MFVPLHENRTAHLQMGARGVVPAGRYERGYAS